MLLVGKYTDEGPGTIQLSLNWIGAAQADCRTLQVRFWLKQDYICSTVTCVHSIKPG